MRFKFKKYIYILNDLTNILLKQERENEKRKVKVLAIVIIVIAIFLLASLIFNLYLAIGA